MARSPFFQIVHEDSSPMDGVAKGTQYSIVRTTLPVLDEFSISSPNSSAFGGACRCPLQLLTFAIIWDEDNDERVWRIIETLHRIGLLAPVRFIGERKGCISIICDDEMDYGSAGFEYCREIINELTCTDQSDQWVADVYQMSYGDRTTYNVQRTTHNVQRTTYNVQRTTYNVQRTTYNVQRTTYRDFSPQKLSKNTLQILSFLAFSL